MIKQEHTYLGADGLAYCMVCGEPVEAYFPPDSILGMKNILDNVHVSVKNVKQKKRHKMMFGLWLGFMGLAGAMALLFWMVLHFSSKK